MSPSEKQLTLGNPYGRVSEAEVSRLLGSAAVMLIYPSDVLQRCPPPADEVQAMRAEPRWRALDVAGQVERLMASRDHGSMDLAQILAQAIAYAEDGYPVTQRVATDFAASLGALDDDARAVFARNGGPVPLGARHSQPRLAATLRKIGEKGRDGFYKGTVADDILAKLGALGGTHTQDDFDSAIGDYVTPINGAFRDHQVWECPPNGQGVIALMLLNIMSGVDRFGDHPISSDFSSKTGAIRERF